MATGRLGVADLSAGADTSVYTCPASTFSVVSVSVCNRAGTSVNVRIAVAASGTPADSEYIEYDSEILANGVLERTGIVMDAGKVLIVRASAGSVSAVVMGIETTTA